MNSDKLKEIVIEEAQEEKERIIYQARKEANEFLEQEISKLDAYYNEKKEKIEQEYSSKEVYIKFLSDSENRKKLLRLKHSLLEEVRQFLTSILLDEIKKNPEKFIRFSLKELNVSKGNFLISKELSNIITENIFSKIAKDLPLKYSGVDNNMNTGVAIELENKKYIFFIKEVIDKFLSNNSQIINEFFEK